MNTAYQNMFTDFRAFLDNSGQSFTRSKIKASEIMIDNPPCKKVVINGDPYNWIGHAWEKDRQARDGEYDSAPEVEDPENIKWLFGG